MLKRSVKLPYQCSRDGKGRQENLKAAGIFPLPFMGEKTKTDELETEAVLYYNKLILIRLCTAEKHKEITIC